MPSTGLAIESQRHWFQIPYWTTHYAKVSCGHPVCPKHIHEVLLQFGEYGKRVGWEAFRTLIAYHSPFISSRQIFGRRFLARRASVVFAKMSVDSLASCDFRRTVEAGDSAFTTARIPCNSHTAIAGPCNSTRRGGSAIGYPTCLHISDIAHM